MNYAYVIDAVRTPRGIGNPNVGALSHLHPQHLNATVLKALATRNAVETRQIDDVIFSTSIQRGKQGRDIGRMSSLLAGHDPVLGGMTLHRFDREGTTAVNLATGQIMSGTLRRGRGC